MSLLSSTFTPRRYQETIFSTAAEKNSLVVLPTGLGKTAIAAMLSAHRLTQHPEQKIVFLAPTKPLAQQHLDTFKDLFELPEERFALFTGSVTPQKRVKLWEEATFIFSTPQGMENDLISRKLDLQDVALMVFDEAHRATGDYAYVYIAQHYHETARNERILALTASPGSDETTIRQVCEHLHIEAIEVRTSQDRDVAPYVQELDITYVNVALEPELKRVRDYLQRSYESKLKAASELGYVENDTARLNKSTLLKLQASLHAQTAHGEKSYELLKTISLLAEALKLQHALELVETQTLSAAVAYLEQLQALARTSKTKAVQNLVRDVDFKSAAMLAGSLKEQGKEHPKIKELRGLVTKELVPGEGRKLIIFTQYRDTATSIKEHLHDIATAEIFVGQAKKKETGLSQKQQKEMIDRFRDGDFPVLIATSVAEEGLDIPSVDTVIFYEPIPSAIRTVQRRGRTGRHHAGKMYMLIAQGTRDEGYRWSAHHKEKRMYRAITKIKQTYTPAQRKTQPTLSDYGQEQPVITVDYREKGSLVMKALLKEGARLDLKQLTMGDYRIGEDIVAEYKNVKDFVDSIVDGRLLSQLSELRTAYKPVVIIEGQEDLYAQRRVSPAAIRGMLATIILSYHIPVLRTMTPADTAGVLMAMAKRTQSPEKHYHAHTNKPWTLREQQEYLVSALPGIGPKLARPLLERFGSVKGVMQASLAELQEIELIGKKKAEAIRELLDAAYKKD